VAENVGDFINISLISFYSFGRLKFGITRRKEENNRGWKASWSNSVLKTVQIKPKGPAQQRKNINGNTP